MNKNILDAEERDITRRLLLQMLGENVQKTQGTVGLTKRFGELKRFTEDYMTRLEQTLLVHRGNACVLKETSKGVRKLPRTTLRVSYVK